MRLTRVFVAAPLAGGAVLQLPERAAQHIVRVLRLTSGAALRVFNGQGGEFDATIEQVRRDQVAVRIGAHHAAACESPLQITLLQGIARGEKMDLILQKATELGITRIVPVQMTRSTVRLDADSSIRKQEHWQAVVISACEQCGRNLVPEVAAPVPLAGALAVIEAELKLLLAPDETSASLPALLTTGSAATPVHSACLLVGPEGGFDPGEVRLAQLAGFHSCRLGPRVLRTETAALAALAALQTLAGDFRG
jgi:16S rRNA (uracil1498-N3)-methyltransferase